MDILKERLKAKVKAVNRANEYANELFPILVEIFQPLVGQQIIKKDGELLAKFQSKLPVFPNRHDLSVHRHFTDYSIGWTVKTCESIGEHTCTYHETTVYIGELQNGMLTGIKRPYPYRSDYTVKEIQDKRKAYEEAKKASDAARDALYPFGETDR